MAKRARRTRTANVALVTLNLLHQSNAITLSCPPDFEERTWRLNYALRNRKRWTTRGATTQRQNEDILKIVRDLGLTVDAYNDIVDNL